MGENGWSLPIQCSVDTHACTRNCDHHLPVPWPALLPSPERQRRDGPGVEGEWGDLGIHSFRISFHPGSLSQHPLYTPFSSCSDSVTLGISRFPLLPLLFSFFLSLFFSLVLFPSGLMCFFYVMFGFFFSLFLNASIIGFWLVVTIRCV